MAGTVRYRLLPSHQLPYGPICIRRNAVGNITVAVDETQMDPILGPTIARLSDGILDVGSVTPLSQVRVHRDHAMAADELVLVSIEAATVEVFLPSGLVKPAVTDQLGVHGTLALRELMRMSPIIGQGPRPAA
ncbi:hypothetical protein ACIBHY_16935 [Nonomuraea sp. NPDC050547]|uniref:hypothetical protein n=1 Tax=Nonomuraea sp. NPDC050547 TaxID=3364368 RepID=UPI00379CB07D